MAGNDFSDGHIEYKVSDKKTSQEIIGLIDFAKWNDGYIAFSNGEKRLAYIKGMDFAKIIKDRITNMAGIEGYVMEVNLWRYKDGIYEEISIEREDRGFLVQEWKLDTNKKGNDTNCYWRNA